MAAFNIQEFRSQMTGDGARPNLFEVELNFPTFVTNSAFARQKASFMCRAAQLPGSTVNSVPVNYFGRELKFAGNRTFPEWTVTVINDEDFAIRKAVERWMNGLNSHTTNIRDPRALRGANVAGTAEGYQTDAYVTQYGKSDETAGGLRVYRFIGVFPIDLSPIELDWAANDQIEEFAVTFSYQWWEDVSAAAGASTIDGDNAPTTS
jgi:hypothetical protein